jgi:large subunit ribosomal protein L22
MEIKVIHRFAPISAHKARLVADLIRGRSVDDALITLQMTRKRASTMINKLLHSAVASAADRFDVEPDELKIAKVWVDGGPMRKTWWARPRGMVATKLHRTSHINLVVATQEDAA